MKTHRNTKAKTGDVIEVRSAVTHTVYGYVVVTDKTANGSPSAGGYDCRAATPAEVSAAKAEGRLNQEFHG